MKETPVPNTQQSPDAAGEETRRLREENQRLRDGLEGVLTIIGNPEGYCENDRLEVAQAVAEAERALGRRPPPVWRRLHASPQRQSQHATSPRAK